MFHFLVINFCYKMIVFFKYQISVILAWVLGLPLIKSSPVNDGLDDSLPQLSTNCPLSFPNLYPHCLNWKERKFDFIIVGGGTAGSTLANRLTENPAWNVLLLEAGGIPSNLSEIPGFFEALQHSPEDWSYTVRNPEIFQGYKNQEYTISKGKVLGGSSTINTMAVVAGIPQDYNHWAQLGNTNWNWANVKPYIDKVLTTIKTTEYTSTSPLRTIIENAAKELGVGQRNTSRYGYGYQDSPIQTHEGQRYNHAKGYLSGIRTRKNLCVVENVIVTGLVFDETKPRVPEEPDTPGSKPLNGNKVKVIGVNVYEQKTQKYLEVKASIEVILSAGAIGTPQILLLSGIGPENDLNSLGIPPKKILPQVGENLIDHMVIPVMLEEITPKPLNPTPLTIPELDEQFCKDHHDSSLKDIGISNYQGYLYTKNTKTYASPDPDERPNLELIHFHFQPAEALLNLTLSRFGFLDYYQNQIKAINKDKSIVIFLVNPQHPKFKGTVKLTSKVPLAPPNINPNWLSNQDDIQVLQESFAYVEKLAGTRSFREYQFLNLGLPHCKEYKFLSPEYWLCYSKTFSMSIFHASGSCKMGTDEGESVVNGKLQVWGVDGLRVVDSSVMPELITGHTNIPTGMIAERAGDFIKQEYGFFK